MESLLGKKSLQLIQILIKTIINLLYYFRYIAGSLHYSRVPAYYWKDRLLKMRAAGLNVVQTYVPWNFHNPFPGVYRFEGDYNVVEFIQTAQDVGLLVILRAGPYVCGEWEMGGFPSWLLRNTSIVLRSSDLQYLKFVDEWYSVFFPIIKHLLYENGGPIITVQVENEYGSYYTCDKNYLQHLENTFRQHLGGNVVLFTTDGDGEGYLKCGTLPSLYATVDFGITNSPNFDPQRKYEPHGPLVNSEFYTGWLDHWGEPHQRRDGTQFANSLDKILQLNASVSMYMFEGGTNFAFWNGANAGGSNYSPQPTSYDYDAPLTEAGDPTDKFNLIRNIIKKYESVPPNIPPATHKTAYGKIEMKEYANLFDNQGIFVRTETNKQPLTFGEMEQNFGFMLYTTKNNISLFPSSTLVLSELHDRASVYWNGQYQGVLMRQGQVSGNLSLSINTSSSAKSALLILVENMGRVNYGSYINDQKGIINGVFLNGKLIEDWQSASIPLNNTETLNFNLLSSDILPSKNAVFFRGNFASNKPSDTFLNVDNWSKGVAFINGFNLGRYWPAKGPQKTLYVPANILKPSPSMNELILFEVDSAPCQPPYSNCYASFVDTPNIGLKNGVFNNI